VFLDIFELKLNSATFDAMAGASKTNTPQDLMQELRNFLSGSRVGPKANHVELTRTALNLLKSLPAARYAVLEYFCTVLDISVARYVSQLEVCIFLFG
jgi:Integrator complex subunit 5 N-terminus